MLVQHGVPYEVIVVDNGSSDGSLDWLRRLSATLAASPAAPPLRILASERNLGFAAGNNLAIRESQAPLIATLNNDAWPEPGCLAALVAAAESDPIIGSCAAQMVFASRPEVINSAGIALDRAGIAWDRESGCRASSARSGYGSLWRLRRSGALSSRDARRRGPVCRVVLHVPGGC